MSGSTRVVFASRAAALLSLVLASQVHAADPPPRSPELRELFRQADEAVKRMDLVRAREIWARINYLEPTTAALCQLGQLDLRIGRWDAAANELSLCVEQMPAPKNATERRRFEVRHADFAAARRQAGEIRILPPPRSTRTLVDGKEVDATRSVYVAPGQHEITATGPQGEIARALVKVAAGDSLSVPLTFDAGRTAAVSKPPAAPARIPPELRQSNHGPKPWIVWTGASAAVAGLAVGIGLHVSAESADDEAESIKRSAVDGRIDPADPRYRPIYEDAMSTHERANTLHAISAAAFVAGAALGAATIVYVALPHQAEIDIRTRGSYAEVRFAW
ncbi:hypothetical protein WME75_35895 [Sorangium sp. So ce1014]|uniref:hypothetical protein n=1 Tax=Sorangium sp. So ce1014 TaxID=3133326 RepID=UPI003F605B83